MTEINLLDARRVDNWDLQQLGDNLGFNRHDYKLLIEAYRRKNIVRTNLRVLGVGSSSTYKSKFFTATDIKDGFTLNQRGKEALQTIEQYFPIPKEEKTKENLNKVLRSFSI